MGTSDTHGGQGWPPSRGRWRRAEAGWGRAGCKVYSGLRGRDSEVRSGEASFQWKEEEEKGFLRA